MLLTSMGGSGECNQSSDGDHGTGYYRIDGRCGCADHACDHGADAFYVQRGRECIMMCAG